MPSPTINEPFLELVVRAANRNPLLVRSLRFASDDMKDALLGCDYQAALNAARELVEAYFEPEEVLSDDR